MTSRNFIVAIAEKNKIQSVWYLCSSNLLPSMFRFFQACCSKLGTEQEHVKDADYR